MKLLSRILAGMFSLIKWPLLRLQYFVSGLLSYLILPAQSLPKYTITRLVSLLPILPSDVKIHAYCVKLSASTSLETYDITRLNSSTRQELIYFCGNYQNVLNYLPDLNLLSQKLDCHVHAFNYRNVGASTGRLINQSDLIADGMSQVKNLLEKGIYPANITLHGHSLGGAVASFVAAKLKEHGIEVKLINDRSFSSIASVISKTKTQKSIFDFCLKWLNWDLNAKQVYTQIDAQKSCLIVAKYDHVIDYNTASLYNALDTQKQDIAQYPIIKKFKKNAPAIVNKYKLTKIAKHWLSPEHNTSLSICIADNGKAILSNLKMFIHKK